MVNLGTVRDNRSASRFELPVGEHVAVSVYRMHEDSIVFTHTEVPRELRGQGIGQVLARGVLDTARERGLDVIPLCPFMAAFIRENPEYHDLVSPSNRARLDIG